MFIGKAPCRCGIEADGRADITGARQEGGQGVDVLADRGNGRGGELGLQRPQAGTDPRLGCKLKLALIDLFKQGQIVVRALKIPCLD